MNKISYSLLVACLVGISYIIYYQLVLFPKKLEECNNIAVAFEKARHSPDDLTVTNQDISSYMKNIVSCLIDPSR